MAAGLGSRFGGLKQLQTVSPKGFYIMDYSIYDAITAGFNTIVFIISKDIAYTLEARYKKAFPKRISIQFVIQDVKNIPNDFSFLRNKPWGTGHALLMLKDIVKASFALINADDFYGKTAFKQMHDALYNSNSKNNFFIGYPVNKTLSSTGGVSRGECYLNQNGYLIKIIERKQILKSKDGSISYINKNQKQVNISTNTIVSMNFWGFSPNIFPIAETLFETFLIELNISENTEFYLPFIVDYTIQQQLASYKMLFSNEQWLGITYKADETYVREVIKQFTNQNLYPEDLW